MAPVVGRLFDRYGPRTVYSLGLLLLGGAFLVASHAQALWQFQLSVGLAVGIGIAFIGNVPNSILLGRWFGPRLPTAMAIVYSAAGAGVLVLLPASQLLIDHVGWRGAYQIFSVAALGLLVPLLLLPWRLFSTGSPHIARKADPDFVDAGWTLASAMRHHAFWALFATFFFTAVGMYALAAQIVAYLIDAGDRATAVGAVQLRHLDSRHHPALAAAVLSELLAARRLRRDLRQHDWLARAADHSHRDEDLSRRAGRHDLRHDLDRQRPWLRARRLGRRPDP
jgi:MFS family permease